MNNLKAIYMESDDVLAPSILCANQTSRVRRAIMKRIGPTYFFS